MVEAKIDTEKKILFAVLLLVLVGAIFGTYAYFSSQSTTQTQTVSTGTLSIELDDSTPIVNATNLRPIDDNQITTMAAKKEFSVTNTGDNDITLTIDLIDIVMDDELKNENFKWALYENNVEVTNGTFNNLSTTSIALANNLTVSTSKDYTLYIWVHNINGQQNSMQDKQLTAKISVNAI